MTIIYIAGNNSFDQIINKGGETRMIYTVKAGDTLSRIYIKEFGLSKKEAYNQIASHRRNGEPVDSLKPGEEIVKPMVCRIIEQPDRLIKLIENIRVQDKIYRPMD